MSGELGPLVKTTAEMVGYLDKDKDSEANSFLDHEISSQNSFAKRECHISEVFTHKDLLERTVRSVGEDSYRRN